MKLDHTIVPCSDKSASARFYAEILGLELPTPFYHFEMLHLNKTLKLLFDTQEHFEPHHYAFRADGGEYASVLERLKQANYPYGDGPNDRGNRKEYRHDSEKGFYFDDRNGHVLEIITDL